MLKLSLYHHRRKSSNPLFGVLSQLMFSGSTFCVSIVAAATLEPQDLAAIAFLNSALLTAATVISSTILVPYSLNMTLSRGAKRTAMMRRVYGTQAMALGLLIAFAIATAGAWAINVTFGLACLFYGFFYLTRFSQRSFQIAERRNLESLLLETAGTVFLALVLLSLMLSSIRLSSSEFVAVLSLLTIPIVVVNWNLSGLGLTASPAVFRVFKRQFALKGRYTLAGAAPSEVLQNGHVYVLTALGQLNLLANIYIATLFYRHISIVLNGVSNVERSIQVELIRRDSFSEASRRAITAVLVGPAMVATNLVFVVFSSYWWSGYLDSGGYTLSELLPWIWTFAALNILLAIRLPLFTFLQATRKLRELSKAVFLSGATCLCLWPLYMWNFRDSSLIAILLIPSVVYTILVVVLFLKRSRP